MPIMSATTIETIECGAAQERGKRLVAVILRKEQLLYDIENCCYVEGDIMPEEARHERHMVQDVGQAGNVDRVTRVLDLAHADILERLYPFTQREISHPLVDDRLRDKPVYGVFLSVPESFSQTTLNLFGKLMHELLVCTAVADWLSITNPQKEETWRRKCGEVMERINQVRNQRRERVRIRPHWI